MKRRPIRVTDKASKTSTTGNNSHKVMSLFVWVSSARRSKETVGETDAGSIGAGLVPAASGSGEISVAEEGRVVSLN